MISISLCMIVKNEEDVLARCLDSAKDLVDEIIIVDTGSTDTTKDIAKSYTNLVYDFEWIDDFSAARNFSFSKATMEYCMWLDADDIILESDAKEFLELKDSLDKTTDIVMLKYNTAFDQNGKPTFSYYRERIIKNKMGYKWNSPIHEVINLSGTILHSSISIAHRKLHPTDPDRNLNIFERMIEKKMFLDPRQQFYYARELYYHARYEEAIAILTTFIDSGLGWIENVIEGCKLLSECYSNLNLNHKVLEALLKSLQYDVPRAELCCEIGAHFFNKNEFVKAVFWYTLASTRIPKYESGGFILPDTYGYLPFMQLCVCYNHLGDIKKAEFYNEKAGQIKPDSSAYLYNKKYFNSLKIV